MDYSIKIKELREKMMLTQTEFAEKLGVKFVTINRWENDHYKPAMKERRKLDLLFKEYNIELNNNHVEVRK